MGWKGHRRRGVPFALSLSKGGRQPVTVGGEVRPCFDRLSTNGLSRRRV